VENIFAYDLALMPVHLRGNHWTLGVIDLKRYVVEYYDSYGLEGGDNQVQHAIMFYLSEEYKRDSQKPFDANQWKFRRDPDTVRQQQFDCGVFTLMWADYRAREESMTLVTNDNMAHFRKSIQASLSKRGLVKLL
jgi:Ulp1 family protease